MAYNTKPDAKYVYDFAKKLIEHWAEQTRLDEIFWGMYMQQDKGRPSVAAMPGQTDRPDALMSGYPGQLIDHDLSVIGNPPTLHFNSASETIKERNKIDFTYEPWIAGVWSMSQVGSNVWLDQARDMRLYGRGFSCMTPLPRLWAEGEYADRVKKLSAAEDRYESSTNGDKEALRARRDDAYKEVVAYEEDPQNFPLRWTHWDARCTYVPDPVNQDRPWPEVVHVRKMKASEAKSDYKVKLVGQSDDAEVKVYHYMNYFYYCCAVAAGDGEPEMVALWKHGLGESPLIVMEGMRFPEGTSGLRWKSALYDYRPVMMALDTLLSDMITGTRRFVRNQIALFLDPEARHAATDDPHAVGHPEQLIKINPNEPYVPLYNTEKVDLMPVPQTTQDSWLAINFLDSNAQNMALTPQERGRLPNSQTSGVTYNQMLEASEGRLHPVSKQLEEAAHKWVRLAIKGTLRFLEEFPNARKLYVLSHEHGSIGVGKDIEGYSAVVNVDFSHPSSVQQLQNFRLGQIALQSGVDPETVYSELFKFKNGRVIAVRSQKYRAQEAVFQGTLAQIQAIMQQAMQRMSAPSAQQFADDLSVLPPEVMDILMEEGVIAPLQLPQPQPMPAPNPMAAGMAPPVAGMMPPGAMPGGGGEAAQLMANIGRAGSPQMPSEIY